MAIPLTSCAFWHSGSWMRRGLLALLALLLVAGGCSEQKKPATSARAKARVSQKPPVERLRCPLTGGPATARGIAGVELGQPIQALVQSCLTARVSSGLISPTLTEARQAVWVVDGKDTLRALAAADGKVVEVDALTPGFASQDSLHVGSSLQEVLRRRPNAAHSGAVQIRQNQLTVGEKPGCGLLAVLSDAMQGQQIELSPTEVSRLPGSLRVKRLAVVRCPI